MLDCRWRLPEGTFATGRHLLMFTRIFVQRAAWSFVFLAMLWHAGDAKCIKNAFFGLVLQPHAAIEIQAQRTRVSWVRQARCILAGRRLMPAMPSKS